jgi:hypothetical protein
MSDSALPSRPAPRRSPRSMAERFTGLGMLAVKSPPAEAAAAFRALVDEVGPAWARAVEALATSRGDLDDARELLDIADGAFDAAARRWGVTVRDPETGAADAAAVRAVLGGVPVSEWIQEPVADELARARQALPRLRASPRGGADELAQLEKTTAALEEAWLAYAAAVEARDQAYAASSAATDAYDAAWAKLARLWAASGADGFPRF